MTDSASNHLRRALFLDRDGVINVDHGYVCSAEQTQFVDGIFDLCRTARDAGYMLVIVTNQAGIGRGIYTEQDYREYMDWMQSVFALHGLRFSGIYHCPHHPTAAKGEYLKVCGCRKPAPGLIRKAATDLGIDLKASILVGDKISDVEAGSAAGVGRNFLLNAELRLPADRVEIRWEVASRLVDITREFGY